jgi:hypothetical protein
MMLCRLEYTRQELSLGTGIAQSVERVSADWTIRSSNTCWLRDFLFSTRVPTGPGTQKASCKIGTEALSRRVKRSGRGFGHPLPSSTEYKNEETNRCVYTYIPVYRPISAWHITGRPWPFTVKCSTFENDTEKFKVINYRIWIKFQPVDSSRIAKNTIFWN